MAHFSNCVFLFILCVWDVEANRALRRMFPDKYPAMLRNGVDPGSPLFLTPYVQKGQFDIAQKLSRVGPLDGTSLESYAGYFTVNATTNSNMFFWFFPAQQNPETAPVLLWLQGGPGGSSLFGLFVENGPLMVDKYIKLRNRKITWNTKYSMIYIDNPVGTGFSFTDKDEGYATNEEDVARDLYSCLTQFFQVFYQYQKNDFYATGESYAGKYVPAISYKIHIENPTAKTKINFKGMAIGDGLCDPATIFDTLFNGDLTPNAAYFYNVTNLRYFFNFLLTEEFSPHERKQKDWQECAKYTNVVMMYNGQLDIIIAVPLTEAFLLTVDWSGQDLYRQVDRLIWRVTPNDKEVAGYVRQIKQFYQVIVRDAGHMLPYDQPERGYDMIQRFVEEKGWTS